MKGFVLFSPWTKTLNPVLCSLLLRFTAAGQVIHPITNTSSCQYKCSLTGSDNSSLGGLSTIKKKYFIYILLILLPRKETCPKCGETEQLSDTQNYLGEDLWNKYIVHQADEHKQ